MTALRDLRRRIKQRRTTLTPRMRLQAGRLAAQQLRNHVLFKKARKVGLYLDAFGEVPTHQLARYCYQQHKTVYLPCIRQYDQTLVWISVSYRQWQQRRFAQHTLGMREPRQHRGCATRQLDVLIMPLVAFDHQGTRLGMGGGYYDRTLAHIHTVTRIGLGYGFQQVPVIARRAWDQPIHAALTPSYIKVF